MRWIFLLLLFTCSNAVFGQKVDSEKPILAFGPWFKKKLSILEPKSKVPIDSSKFLFHQKQIDSLVAKGSRLESGSDSVWRAFIKTYEALINEVKGDRSVEPYAITDEFLSQVIMQASRARMPLVANAFINESKRIHPFGTYRTNLNCKHE